MDITSHHAHSESERRYRQYDNFPFMLATHPTRSNYIPTKTGYHNFQKQETTKQLMNYAHKTYFYLQTKSRDVCCEAMKICLETSRNKVGSTLLGTVEKLAQLASKIIERAKVAFRVSSYWDTYSIIVSAGVFATVNYFC